MKLYYRFMLWRSELELALALSAPVRNPKVVKATESGVSRWELALLQHTLN